MRSYANDPGADVMRATLLLATLLLSSCTETVHLDTNGDGTVTEQEACAGICACDSVATCEQSCIGAFEPACGVAIGHCVLEEKYEGGGCEDGVTRARCTETVPECSP